MSNEAQRLLDAETRAVLIGAIVDDLSNESVSDEDLAVVAEQGLRSFNPEQRDHILNAMIMNTDGARGAIDVFRLLHDESEAEESQESLGFPTHIKNKRFDFVSGSMVGIWAVAACIALFFSVSSFRTPNAQVAPEGGWSRENGLGVSDQEDTKRDLIETFFRKMLNGKQGDLSQVENMNAKRMWMGGAVLVMILVPPFYLVYRRKQNR